MAQVTVVPSTCRDGLTVHNGCIYMYIYTLSIVLFLVGRVIIAIVSVINKGTSNCGFC